MEPDDFYSSQIPPSSPPVTSSQSLSTRSEILPVDPRLQVASELHDEIHDHSSVSVDASPIPEGSRFSLFDK